MCSNCHATFIRGLRSFGGRLLLVVLQVSLLHECGAATTTTTTTTHDAHANSCNGSTVECSSSCSPICLEHDTSDARRRSFRRGAHAETRGRCWSCSAKPQHQQPCTLKNACPNYSVRGSELSFLPLQTCGYGLTADFEDHDDDVVLVLVLVVRHLETVLC